jgi:hypothetical protein
VNLEDYSQIPRHMMESMVRYMHDRIEPGGFLYAVVTNDLKGAVARADSTNIELIPVYVSFLYNEAPSECWGSNEKVGKWLSGREQ